MERAPVCAAAVAGKTLRMSIRSLLYTIAVIALAIWIINLIVWHGGEVINLLLVVAVILVIYNLVTGRRTI
jgi:hypothetical protein